MRQTVTVLLLSCIKTYDCENTVVLTGSNLYNSFKIFRWEKTLFISRAEDHVVG